MKEEKQENQNNAQKNRKVHVTALYTLTANEAKFVAEVDTTFKAVVEKAYDKLGEHPRPGDQYFCHGTERKDLAPYFHLTLKEMKRQGICIRDTHHEKLEFDFDIDAEVGGA